MAFPKLILTRSADPAVTTPESQLVKAILDLLSKNPLALVSIGLAWISGNVWVYIILGYFSIKERDFLSKNWCKMSVGIIWFSLIYVFFHLITYKNLIISFTNVLEHLISVVIISYALQFIVLLFVSVFSKKGNV